MDIKSFKMTINDFIHELQDRFSFSEIVSSSITRYSMNTCVFTRPFKLVRKLIIAT